MTLMQISLYVKTAIITYGGKIIVALLVLLIGFKLTNYLEKLITKSKGWKKMDPTLQSFSGSAFKFGLKALVLVSAILIAGVPSATFVAVLGAAGLAIGLALQGSLSNLAGGVLITALHPFKVGDYIEGAGHSGTVSGISLFYTELTTPDNRKIVIPNASISGSSVVNYSANPTRRVDFEFGVGYGSSIDHVKQTIRGVIEQNDKIKSDPEPFIRLAAHGDSALVYKVRVWVDAPDYWDVYFTMMEEVKEALDREQIDIPYPQRVVTQIK